MWTDGSVRLIIAGSRAFKDYALLHYWVDKLIADRSLEVTEVLSGGAAGTDEMGERWAKEHDILCLRFCPMWHTHGRSAGPIRNEIMAKDATHLIAFSAGGSRGTSDMIVKARKHNLDVAIVQVGVRPPGVEVEEAHQ